MSRPRVVYVSYDGAGEPLGRSQVLAYLERLARDCDITLISFEKDHTSRPETARLLRAAGIAWRPLSYHKRPPVLSTAWDVVAGARKVRRACRSVDADIVHVRSYVPALIALAAGRQRRWKLLFDIRGFWADERVEGSMWPPGGWLYRLAKRCERRFFRAADAVVTLTAASVPAIRELGAPTVPVEVIPTCADLDRFLASEPRADGPRAVWCGSVGTFYRFDLAVRFAEAAQLPLVVLTRQVEAARSVLGDRPAVVREAAPADVALELRPGDIGISFLVGSYDGGVGRFANLARAPTRFAEYLAAGMTVAVSPGVGDLDAIVESHDLGVVLASESDAEVERAARRARELAAAPATWERARAVARERYPVEQGAARYLDLYRRLLASSTASAG
jgi:glycosyltransferase involved in cell wall biosynthesis